MEQQVSRRGFLAGAAVGAAGSAAVLGGIGAGQALAEEKAAASLNDGVYSAAAKGFHSDVTVTLTVDGGAVSSVDIDVAGETPDRGGVAAEKLSEQIVAQGGTAGIDAWAGATMTSKAIFLAADDCLAQAAGETADAAVPPVVMRPGIYVGEGWGMNWIEPVQVKIEVDETSLLSVEVIELELNREEPLILKAACDRMIPRMIEAQSVTVDSVCGATSSSAGIKAATEDALAKALVAGGADPSAIRNFYVTPTYTPEVETVLDYDVVVCGMGGAGCAAAMATAECMVIAGRPVSVLAIETAGKYGGTASNAGGAMGCNAPSSVEANGGYPTVDTEALFADWTTNYAAGTGCKPECVNLMMEDSGFTIDWLIGHGFAFTPAMEGGTTKNGDWLSKYEYLYGSNLEEGVDYEALFPGYVFGDRSSSVGQYYDHIVADYEYLGGKYMLETTATELIYDAKTNKVTGVRAVDNVTHARYTINAKAVIMCTGGFGGNEELHERYLKNPFFPLDRRWNLWGMRQNKGQVIESAINQGMATYNIDMPPMVHFKTTAGRLDEYPTRYRDGLDARMFEQNSWSLNDIPLILGMMTNVLQVGQDGLRHYNEAGPFAFWAAGPVWYTILGSGYIRSVATSGFRGQAGGYQGSIMMVYNHGGYPNGRPVPQIYEVLGKAEEKGYVFRADTLEELAEKIEVPVDAFLAQVERYKGYVAAGVDEEFGRPASTMNNDLIGKTGPFYAIKCNPVPYATCAAMDVDDQVNVLLPDGTQVGGLYACGNDSGGVLESNAKQYYSNCCALGWAFTSGRLAGINACNYLEQAEA